MTTIADEPAHLRIHVEELLAEHLISVDYSAHCHALADPRRRHLVIRPIATVEDYTAALLTIGELVGPDAALPGGPVDPDSWARSVALRSVSTR